MIKLYLYLQRNHVMVVSTLLCWKFKVSPIMNRKYWNIKSNLIWFWYKLYISQIKHICKSNFTQPREMLKSIMRANIHSPVVTTTVHNQIDQWHNSCSCRSNGTQDLIKVLSIHDKFPIQQFFTWTRISNENKLKKRRVDFHFIE